MEWKTIASAKRIDERVRSIIGRCTNEERGEYPGYSEFGWMEVNFLLAILGLFSWAGCFLKRPSI